MCQNLISCPKENLIGTANTQIPQKRGKAQPCTPSIVIQDIADTQVSPSPLIREHSEWCTEKKLLLGSSSLQHLLLHFPAEYPLLSNMEAYKICVPSRRLLAGGGVGVANEGGKRMLNFFNRRCCRLNHLTICLNITERFVSWNQWELEPCLLVPKLIVH